MEESDHAQEELEEAIAGLSKTLKRNTSEAQLTTALDHVAPMRTSVAPASESLPNMNPITSGPNCGLIELAGSSGILSATGLLLGYNKINNINRTPGNVTYTSGECMYGNGRANIAKLGEEFGSRNTPDLPNDGSIPSIESESGTSKPGIFGGVRFSGILSNLPVNCIVEKHPNPQQFGRIPIVKLFNEQCFDPLVSASSDANIGNTDRCAATGAHTGNSDRNSSVPTIRGFIFEN